LGIREEITAEHREVRVWIRSRVALKELRMRERIVRGEQGLQPVESHRGRGLSREVLKASSMTEGKCESCHRGNQTSQKIVRSVQGLLY